MSYHHFGGAGWLDQLKDNPMMTGVVLALVLVLMYSYTNVLDAVVDKDMVDMWVEDNRMMLMGAGAVLLGAGIYSGGMLG